MPRPDAARHPHGGQRVLMGGAPHDSARGGLVAIHGRGAGAEDIFALAKEVVPPDIAILAPQAAGNTWYPYRFLEPTERNEPYLSSALQVVADLIAQLGEHGIPSQRVALLGFSQGACLALEATARNPQRYAGVIGFSGGLIGPPGTAFDFAGSLDGTPVFIGIFQRNGSRSRPRHWTVSEPRLTFVSIREWVTRSTATSWKPRGRSLTMRLARDSETGVMGN
jgi:phospholipase/carboxylesterase